MKRRRRTKRIQGKSEKSQEEEGEGEEINVKWMRPGQQSVPSPLPPLLRCSVSLFRSHRLLNPYYNGGLSLPSLLITMSSLFGRSTLITREEEALFFSSQPQHPSQSLPPFLHTFR